MEVKIERIGKTYETVTVINDISFSLEKGQKVGLVGGNGTGKSTLLQIIAGLVEPDAGTVTLRKGLTIGYMPQDTSLMTDETIGDYLRRVTGIGDLEAQLETSPEAVEEYESRGGYSFDYRMQITLAGFGLSGVDNDRSINTLSSGQKSKVLMAGVLLSDADLLLLDEPTNNLDLSALIWLEDFLMRSPAACLVVSHDRTFLDRVVRKIFEIDWHTRSLNVTNGRYSDYLERREKERRKQAADYEAQQEETQRLVGAAKSKRAQAAKGANFRGSASDKFLQGFKRDRAAGSSRAAKAIEKRIEQMEKVEKPLERELFRINIRPLKPGGSKDIVLQGVVAGYAQSGFQIGPISAIFPYGSRVVILGLNGSGKSTLLKTIGGELSPLAGEVRVGNALIIGNLMQEHDNLPRETTLSDLLTQKGHLPVPDAYALAVHYGFSPEEIGKTVSNLSPGGRSRLLLALFSALSVNTLLLDEPTNHLDIEALEALEEAVTHYEGTIVLVSHDRYFLQKFNPTDTYVLSDGKLDRQQNYEAYLADAEREAKRLINML
ncbi:MAG: ABC-F family ATP-binding cassette domain-containing protein [Patescibacteria group bacterium]|jgi:ATPase subunit of ABC transporter with duplicated ATPase domains